MAKFGTYSNCTSLYDGNQANRSKIVEVEKKLNWWQKTKIEIGGWSMIMNILLVSMMIVRWLRKKGGARNL